MIIPFNQLHETTLQNLIEEFVIREDDNNGDIPLLQQRVDAVMNQLLLTKMVIVYDEITETTNIVPTKSLSI
ncbi:MAG: YheU family protein [Endozoicomonadaceae bacterium]|nr:YheU family protein [Endozoicomonadaceae bacterium]